MKISKFQILTDITSGFGIAGTLAIIIGGGSCMVGLTATGVMKAGEFFSNHQPMLQKMMFYGSAGAGSGLFFVGVAAAAAQLRDEAGEEEMERISTRYEEAVQRSQIRPENKQRTWAEWQEYEEIKRFCRGCQYYQGGGRCALHGESMGGCGDRREKSVCGNCKFYNGEELLPCAVHPLGLRRNCSDWEPNTDD